VSQEETIAEKILRGEWRSEERWKIKIKVA